MNDNAIIKSGDKLQYHCSMNDNGTNNGSIYIEKFPGHAYCIAKAPKYTPAQEWDHNAKLIIDAISSYNGKTKNACEWTEHVSPGGEIVWLTDCCHAHEFMADGPFENSYRFCPYCGKLILPDNEGGES